MEEVRKFLTWYLALGGDISKVNRSELYRKKFREYDNPHKPNHFTK